MRSRYNGYDVRHILSKIQDKAMGYECLCLYVRHCAHKLWYNYESEIFRFENQHLPVYVEFRRSFDKIQYPAEIATSIMITNKDSYGNVGLPGRERCTKP